MREIGEAGEEPTADQQEQWRREREEWDALFQRVRAGDQAAFERLVEGTWKGLYRLAYGQLGDPQASLNLVAESFRRVREVLPKLRSGRQFRHRLWTEHVHQIRRELRRRQRQTVTSVCPADAPPAAATSPRPRRERS